MDGGYLASLKSPSLLITISIAVYVIRKLSVYYRLQNFPGPPSTGFTNFLHSKATYNCNAHLWYAEVSKAYGPIARIAPNILITSDTTTWVHINKSKAYKKSDWFYHSLRTERKRDFIFSETNNERHDETRRKLTPGYSGRENHELEGSIDDCVSQFINLLRSKHISTQSHVVPVDISAKMQYFTLDVISTVSFGKAFGMMASDSDVGGYAASTADGLRAMNFIILSGMHWILQAPIIGALLAVSTKDKTGVGRMMGSAYAVVNEREANPTENSSDMLASFIRNGLVGKDLQLEVVGQIVAGSDTSAGAMRAIILQISTNPRVHAKLRREIDEASVPKDTIIPFSKAKTLKYLQAVIREAMRCITPALAFFPRDVPEGGDTVPLEDGKTAFVPGGTTIGISTLAMHLNPEVFGEDVNAFRPERWFEPDLQKLEKMKQINDLIFGSGRFGCLGKPVAQLEISKCVFELFRNFDIATIDPRKPWNAKVYTGLYVIDGMWMQLMERDIP